MVKRLANVIFYISIILSLMLFVGGIFSFDSVVLLICVLSSVLISLIGWGIRYILTGDTHFIPTVDSFLKKNLHKFIEKSKKIRSNMRQKDEWSEEPVHPWRRYFARFMDIITNGIILYFFLGMITLVVSPTLANRLFMMISMEGWQVFDGILTAFFSTFLTAALIGVTGSSLGKFIFGVRVTNKSDSPIGAFRAWKREINIFFRGLGLGIPIISFFTIYSAYKKLLKDGNTSWDQKGEYKVTYRNNNLKQCTLNVFGFILLIIIIVCIRAL